ncbi:MAG: transglutaminase domain-containing protein [Thermoleophilia bacterium]|nr:transglutaminase domain-containing protein [Thermoleophilia bacterium]
MRAITRILYFACFVGLALVAALALDRVVEPSMATTFTRTVLIAGLCAAPGLIHRRAWPLAIILVPAGLYLLVRTIMPVPALVEGFGGQYRFYTDQLYQGMLYYRSSLFPLPVSESPALQLVLAFWVYWLVAVAAFVGLSLRKALPAVILILVLVGFGMTVDASERALWSAFLFLVLAACLLVLSRGVRRSGWRLRETVIGGAVGAVAGALALLLLVTAPSVVATPWRDWRTWDPFGQNESVYTFNWLQNYPELLDPANNAVVMTVESPSPSYWRANALDQFTGNAWVASQAFVRRVVGVRSFGDYVYEIPGATVTPPGETVEQVFAIHSVSTYYLFTGGDPQIVTVDQSVPLFMNDMRALRVSAALGPSIRYSVTAVVPELTPADLVGQGADYPANLDDYLLLPFPRLTDLTGEEKEATWRELMSDGDMGDKDWQGLYALNQQIVREATDPYQVTLRIERYLRQLTYSLKPPASKYSSPYAAFLFDTRSGYCQHFAGSMAMLLRYNGIPSRVAVGFATGELESPGVYVVSRNNAHAWVEAYFPTVGWVAFDPTPGRNLPALGGSSSSPGFVNPFVQGGSTDTPAVTTEPTLPRNPSTDPAPADPGDETGRSWWSQATWLPWVAGLVIVLVGWPLVRGLWRRRRLHRGSWERRVEASLGLLRTELSDYGAPVTPAQTLDELLGTVETHVGLKPDQELVHRAEAVLFGGRKATQTDFQRMENVRRVVEGRLRKRHGLVRTGLTLYGIPRLRRHSGDWYTIAE